MRMLATLRQIDSLTPIEKADRIETAWFGGWSVVVQKGLHKQGDTVIYIEVDSCLPVDNPLFASLAERGAREIEGVRYHRLKTIKLKKQISQGFVLPVRETDIDPSDESLHDVDLAEHFGIIKWDPEVHQPNKRLAGNAKGQFPTHLLSKTDAERVQNCWATVKSIDTKWECSLKIDGTSCTVYKIQGDYGICSRNLELKLDDSNNDNIYVIKGKELLEKISHLDNIAFQGEIYGEGIQQNKENIVGIRFAIFDIVDLVTRKKYTSTERIKLCAELNIDHVPIIHEAIDLPKTVQDCLAMATGPSVNSPLREGIVFKSISDPEISFKAISNEWLLKFSDD